MAACEITPSCVERFRDAYVIEMQHWVDAAKRGEVGGPTVWDGYATAACCEADVTEPPRIGAIGIDRRHEPSAKRLFTVPDDDIEFRELPQLIRLEERLIFFW